MTKTYMDLLSTSRIRPKILGELARRTEPVSTRNLARCIEEDMRNVGSIIKIYAAKGFVEHIDGGYVLARTDVREELIALTSPARG